MSDEATTLDVTRELIKKVVETKKEFASHVEDMDKIFEAIKEDFDEIHNERDEILRELNSTKLISNSLSDQLLKISELMEKGNIQPEIIRKMVENTRIFIARCPKCKRESRGTINKILNLGICKACNEQYDLLTLHQYE